jgi:FtsZ-binding cell division protein ZapB
MEQDKLKTIRRDLEALFQAAGYRQEELLHYVDALEDGKQLAEETALLRAEVERLKEDNAKLRAASLTRNGAGTSSSMSSKLREALRE